MQAVAAGFCCARHRGVGSTAHGARRFEGAFGRAAFTAAPARVGHRQARPSRVERRADPSSRARRKRRAVHRGLVAGSGRVHQEAAGAFRSVAAVGDTGGSAGRRVPADKVAIDFKRPASGAHQLVPSGDCIRACNAAIVLCAEIVPDLVRGDGDRLPMRRNFATRKRRGKPCWKP